MCEQVSAIIVSHNSDCCIPKCIACLRQQSHPVNEIIIVDCGSADTKLLYSYQSDKDVIVCFEPNIGFSKANNIGFEKRSSQTEFVLFLNPDTFIEEDLVEKAVIKLNNSSQTGVLTGRLCGFDLKKNTPTGRLDSTGIFRKVYGRWYDRGHQLLDSGQFMIEEEVPALCGALLFCRVKALESLGKMVFDQDFFLYKEDIELSLRLRRKGWKLIYFPKLRAYHCRGWKKRSEIKFGLRKIAAESDILLYKKHPSPYIVWAYLKYWLVVIFRV